MTTKVERAAIYARCRILNPEQEDVSLEQQLHDCYAYCHDRAYAVGEQQVYCELGEGDPMLAPQLSRLRQAAAHGQFDVLVTATADRIDEQIIRDTDNPVAQMLHMRKKKSNPTKDRGRK